MQLFYPHWQRLSVIKPDCQASLDLASSQLLLFTTIYSHILLFTAIFKPTRFSSNQCYWETTLLASRLPILTPSVGGECHFFPKNSSIVNILLTCNDSEFESISEYLRANNSIVKSEQGIYTQKLTH